MVRKESIGIRVFRDRVVATAVALVNQLTGGIDGLHRLEAPRSAAERRRRLAAVPALADHRPTAADLDRVRVLG